MIIALHRNPAVLIALSTGLGLPCAACNGGTSDSDSNSADTGISTADTGGTDTADTFISNGDLLLDHAFATLIADQPSESAGWRVSPAGDFDGDGEQDIVISAIRDNLDGATYLVPGPFGAGEVYLSDIAVRAPGVGDQYFVGRTVTGAGDLNGDGLDDVAISVGDLSADDSSALYVMCGGPIASYSMANTCARIHTDGLTQLGSYATSPMGDVNGDGLSDLLTTSPNADIGAEGGSGAAYLFQGPILGEVGVDQAAWTVTGSHADQRLGEVASAEGDVNGDGTNDVAIGGIGRGGGVYLFHGPLGGTVSDADAEDSWFGTGQGWSVSIYSDLDGDGYEDVVCGVDAQDGEGVTAAAVFAGGVAGTELSSGNPTGVIWGDSVSGPYKYRSYGLGDIDGDTRDEMALTPADGAKENPALHVFRGPIEGNVEIDSADWILFKNHESFGAETLAPAGDLDGDGQADFIMGMRDLSIGGENAGGAYLFVGAGF